MPQMTALRAPGRKMYTAMALDDARAFRHVDRVLEPRGSGIHVQDDLDRRRRARLAHVADYAPADTAGGDDQ